MEAIGLVFMSIPIGFFILMIYVINRSRCSLEEAAQLSGYSQQDLQELIQARMLDYRRKYLVFGSPSLNVSEIATAQAGYQEIRRIRAESDARIRQQEEIEYMRKVYQEIRKSLLAGRIYLASVAEAFSVLGLAHDASFEDVQQRYRNLSKRYHPDAGGNAEQFIRVNTAYQTIRTWLESKGNRNA